MVTPTSQTIANVHSISPNSFLTRVLNGSTRSPDHNGQCRPWRRRRRRCWRWPKQKAGPWRRARRRRRCRCRAGHRAEGCEGREGKGGCWRGRQGRRRSLRQNRLNNLMTSSAWHLFWVKGLKKPPELQSLLNKQWHCGAWTVASTAFHLALVHALQQGQNLPRQHWGDHQPRGCETPKEVGGRPTTNNEFQLLVGPTWTQHHSAHCSTGNKWF